MKKELLASVSEITSSDLYMTIKAVQLTVPDANLNGVRCTKDFIAEIVENQDKYIGQPLCADIDNLVQGDYENLGHCYDPNSDRFFTSIIGSFYRFEIEESIMNGEEKQSLVGYARVMKRNKGVCQAIASLFASGSLKFSFEIACGDYSEEEDGTFLIDRSPNNMLEGMCIVSFPACPEAIALQLVAELKRPEQKEANRMPEPTVVCEEQKETEVAEVIEPKAADIEETAACKEEKKAEEEPAQENAEAKPEEQAAEEKKEEVAEVKEETVAAEETPAPEKHEVAEDNSKYIEALAEMVNAIKELKAEIAELKKPQEVTEPEGVHPFIAEMTAPKKYSLLEKA